MLRQFMIIIALPLFILAAGCSLIEDDAVSNGSRSADLESPSESGTIIINVETEPANDAGSFTFTGVPSGTLSSSNNLVISNLEPGTYTTTEVDPAPDFDVSAANCEDSADDGLASSADPATRTAVVNLDAGETVSCTFSNTRRATAVVLVQTEPQGAAGQFSFTGVPSGTIPAAGTLVTAELPPGTYTTTEVDPAPQFDLTDVSCDDGASPLASGGDPSTRSANFQLDPGEMVTCTFLNTRRGAAIVAVETDQPDDDGTFLFTGVPSGTLPSGGTLIVADLSPGTYTTTLADPAPRYELLEVQCDDHESGLASSGDRTTRSAIYNIDAGETVTCLYSLERIPNPPGEIGGSEGTGSDDEGISDGTESAAEDKRNPFQNPDPDFENFPLPDDLTEEAGTSLVPLAGPWSAVNMAGQMDCGVTAMQIPAQAAESGVLEVLDGGETLVGRGLSGETADITLTADPEIAGRYAGSFQATEQGVPLTIDYFWQVVTEEYIIGYLTSTFSSEGVDCTIYRPFELRYMPQGGG